MLKKNYILLFLLQISVLSVRANLDSLLTGIDTIKGLSQSEPPRNFESYDLYTMINGGAEIYIEYGFKNALDVAYLTDGTNRIGIQIYEMTDDAASYGIFSSSRNIGDSSLKTGDYSSGNPYYIMVQKSRFFYIVSSAESTSKSYSLLTNLAATISSNIKNSAKLPDLVKKSIKAGFGIDQIKYISGKIALTGSYFFSHKDVFKSNNSICINEGNSRIFIFGYTDSIAAGIQLNTVKTDMQTSGRFTDFKTENARFDCIDRNSKSLTILNYKQYIVAISGSDNINSLLQKIKSDF